MGDPKRIRKKYETPSHPWVKSRIDEEARIRKKYVTGNKKEIWKIESVLKNFKTQAKKFIVLDTPQSKVETQQLFKKVKELGLLSDVSFDSILGLTLDDVMDRRLQTVVFKKGLAHSMKQARQFIVHEHVMISGKVITSPNHLVRVKDESSVGFSTSSALFSEQHPERVSAQSEEESTDDATKAQASAKAKVESKTLSSKATGAQKQNVSSEEDKSEVAKKVVKEAKASVAEKVEAKVEAKVEVKVEVAKEVAPEVTKDVKSEEVSKEAKAPEEKAPEAKSEDEKVEAAQ